MLAGAGAAVGEWLHDMPIYYPDLAFAQLAIGAFMLVSGVIAGLGSWLLVRARLDRRACRLPSGREQPAGPGEPAAPSHPSIEARLGLAARRPP